MRASGIQNKRVSVAENILSAQLPTAKADGFAFRILSGSVSFFLRLLARLPLRALHALGALLGWITYLSSATYRRRVCANLSLAGYTDRRVRHGAIAEAGKAVLEIPYIWFRPRAHVLGLIREVRGADVEAQSRGLGRGVIFLTPHIGCFELLSFWVARAAPLTVLYRPPKLAWLRPVMDAGRARENIQLAPTNLSGVRRMLRALRNNEAIGLLPDQVPSFGEGAWIEFFGRAAYTMTLPERLAANTGAQLVVLYMERLKKGQGYRVHLANMAMLAGDEPFLRRLNHGIEAAIRECPTQYLWGYNRYKGSSAGEGSATPVAKA